MRTRRRGYILVETITAMAILSVTAITVQRALHVAVEARGLARDYSTAQFLLDNLVAEKRLQPRLRAGDGDSGTFPPPNERFQYRWRLEEVSLPLPELPAHYTAEQITATQTSFLGHMGRLEVTITWTRAGEPNQIVAETLLSPDQVWREVDGGTP